MNEQHFDALPPVTVNQQPNKQVTGEGGEVPKTSQGEQPASSAAAPAAGPLPITTPLPAPASTDGSGAAPVIPAMADDVDLIEKEWVEKAKQIVEQTKHDPYQQNEAMTKMKTDYLKKRYNRDIKVSEV